MSMTPLPFDPIARAEQNWRARGWHEPDAMSAVTSIVRVQQLLLKRLDALLARFDLTFARYEILALLALSGRGSMPMGKIGERLQVHPASVTSAIQRLERSGYVTRSPDPTDARVRLAALTSAGAAAQRQATKVLGNARYGLDGLDDVAARQITSILRHIRSAAGDFVA